MHQNAILDKTFFFYMCKFISTFKKFPNVEDDS